jgi:hypothetical protein
MNTTSCPGGSDGNGDGVPNFIGRKVAKLRYQREWTQEMLVAKMQIRGCNITRHILANIENKRSIATDKHVFFFAQVFAVDINELYRQ